MTQPSQVQSTTNPFQMLSPPSLSPLETPSNQLHTHTEGDHSIYPHPKSQQTNPSLLTTTHSDVPVNFDQQLLYALENKNQDQPWHCKQQPTPSNRSRLVSTTETEQVDTSFYLTTSTARNAVIDSGTFGDLVGADRARTTKKPLAPRQSRRKHRSNSATSHPGPFPPYP